MSKWKCICGNLCCDIVAPDPNGYVYFTDCQWLNDLLDEPNYFTKCDRCGTLAFVNEERKLEFYKKVENIKE